jgi:RNA polymerase sigma-70 factor, ECF subfamily
MASTLQSAMIGLTGYLPRVESQKTLYSEIYEQNCHRIYSLAFWMTDNEITAEDLSANTFLRAFAGTIEPRAEQIDRAFVAEVRELTPVGALTLNCVVSPDSKPIYGNVKRIHLERALVQLPATEKLIFLFHDVEGYEHSRISRLFGITEEESRSGLHQARLQLRNLIAGMQ